MIAIDTSAVLAILLGEREEDAFARLITVERTVIGAPTLVEVRLALEGRFSRGAEAVLRRFLADHPLDIAEFDTAMFDAAIDAFARFGRGRGHPARLNFGDCLSYAVAKTLSLPLLFKGADFTHTDLVPAHRPLP